jgi:peptide/nickel transport system permease protein
MNESKDSKHKRAGRLSFITGGVKIRWNKEMFIGGGIIAFFSIVSIVVAFVDLLHVRWLFGSEFANVRITPYNPIQQNVGLPLSSPSLRFPFGTDQFGRDVFSRMIEGAPYGFGIGFAVVGFAMIVGISVGCFAGFRGGLFDEALMRTTDIFFAIPALILAIAIVARLGAGLLSITLALMIVWWPAYARLARGETLKVAHQNYIEAAKTSGFGTVRVVIRHVIPNIFLTLVVYATLDLGTVVLFYAGLSYLGLSIAPPAPDWGYMVANYQDFLITRPYLTLIPGVTIAIAAIGFALFGDGFRDALEVAST